MIILDQIKGQLPALQTMLKEAGESLDPAGLEAELSKIEEQITVPNFWDDQEKAQRIMKEKKSLENALDEFNGLKTRLEDLEVMIEMAEEAEGSGEAEEAEMLAEEAQPAAESLEKDLESLKLKTLLDGKYDKNNAIISVHAGSGGTEAMDWAEMIFRMYTRWCEKRGFKAKLMDMNDDVEAGIKSATLLVEGDYAYGYLKNEKGVHRLVRISPFDSSGRRHTSFASLDVTHIEQLVNRQGLTDNNVSFDMNSKFFECIDLFCNYLLGQTELGNAVHKYTACGVKCLINSNLISLLRKISCAGKTGRTGADNCNSVSVACGFYGFFGAEGIVPIGNKSFKSADANALALDSSYTLRFALCFLRTNSAAYRRERG